LVQKGIIKIYIRINAFPGRLHFTNCILPCCRIWLKRYMHYITKFRSSIVNQRMYNGSYGSEVKIFHYTNNWVWGIIKSQEVTDRICRMLKPNLPGKSFIY